MHTTPLAQLPLATLEQLTDDTRIRVLETEGVDSELAMTIGQLREKLVSGDLVFPGSVVVLGDLTAVGQSGSNDQMLAPAYRSGNVQVVGAQGDGVADATDAASAITQLNELLARCRAHGLIAS